MILYLYASESSTSSERLYAQLRLIITDKRINLILSTVQTHIVGICITVCLDQMKIKPKFYNKVWTNNELHRICKLFEAHMEYNLNVERMIRFDSQNGITKRWSNLVIWYPEIANVLLSSFAFKRLNSWYMNCVWVCLCVVKVVVVVVVIIIW